MNERQKSCNDLSNRAFMVNLKNMYKMMSLSSCRAVKSPDEVQFWIQTQISTGTWDWLCISWKCQNWHLADEITNPALTSRDAWTSMAVYAGMFGRGGRLLYNTDSAEPREEPTIIFCVFSVGIVWKASRQTQWRHTFTLHLTCSINISSSLLSFFLLQIFLLSSERLSMLTALSDLVLALLGLKC